MLPQEIIRKKRDGGELLAEEIASIVRGIHDGSLSEGQVAAFAMAVFFRGMTTAERVALTLALMRSGAQLEWKSLALPGPVVDKHSSGGVGDKVSLMLAPIVAACGLFVPMISGRGLGHTGGTLDKLSAISGYETQPDIATFRKAVKEVGCAIIGQTDDLAPADRRLYATRDITATVESIPLITASILSKKLSEDIDGVVVDVKTGSGAFMPKLKDARNLARSLVDVCRKMKTKIVVLITDMEQPSGRAIGNAIEIRESIQFLKGKAPEDLETICMALAAHMVRLGGRARSAGQASKLVYEAVSKGEALKRLRAIICAQGGDDRIIDNPALLPRAAHVQEFRSRISGFVTRCDAKLLGLASNALGAGRTRLDDVVDPGVGLYLEKKIGDRVREGEVLCRIHWNDKQRLHDAAPLVEEAFEIKARPAKGRPLIHAVLEG